MSVLMYVEMRHVRWCAEDDSVHSGCSYTFSVINVAEVSVLVVAITVTTFVCVAGFAFQRSGICRYAVNINIVIILIEVAGPLPSMQ